jgi:hypothetical protein
MLKIVKFSFAIAFLFHSFFLPYRDDPIWKIWGFTKNRTGFFGLMISDDKENLIDTVSRKLKPKVHGKSALVIGPDPWLYIALELIPKTSMLFMHFTGGEKVNEQLAGTIYSKDPDLIIITVKPPVIIAGAIEMAVKGRGYHKERLVMPISSLNYFNDREIDSNGKMIWYILYK